MRASRNVIFAEPVDERVRDRVTAVREGLEAVVFLGLGRLACLVLVGQCLAGKIGKYRICAAVFSARSFLDGKQHVVIQRQGSAQASDAIYLTRIRE